MPSPPGGALPDLTGALLTRCTFPAAGAELACAVSGGPDSLALLVLAVAAGCRVTAFHVDHGLRPGSAGEADVVAAAAGRFGAGFVSLQAAVAPGPNLEERARDARRSVLPEGAATGHTADDQAETVVLNLLRGAGLDGLAGMRAGPAHPILGVRREETARLCRAAGLVPVVDPTNASLDLRRNRVRHEVMPLLERVAGRDVAAVISRQAALLAADADQLDALAAGIDPRSVAEVAAAPTPLSRRALRAWLRGALGGHPPSAAALERVMAVVRLEARAAEVGRGVTVRRRAGRLYFTHD
ncbi:MAG TPA: tRNA lysidine(34) synthetase TilS [Acidimicrobiales bacterium]|nr:tRNA lysidine(34) synthetase TilS [Acidimicrobiales bacterium]